MSDEKKPDEGLTEGQTKQAADADKGTGEAENERLGSPATIGANDGVEVGAASAGEAESAAQQAKANAQDALDRGVKVNPGEVADAVKSLSAEGTPAADTAPADPEREAKVRAAAEARAARAAAKAAAAGDAPAAEAKPAAERPARTPRGAAKAADEGPKPPSPNQPLLDRVVAILKETVGEDAIEQAYINEIDGHRPYLVIKGDRWPQAAAVFRDHAELKCDYLRHLAGVDLMTHMEVVYHLLSLTSKREYGVKVKTDREAPSVPSVTPVWATANWNEREVYDLFGIDFPGHPDLRRIMMPDDWVGHPLRKDYEPLDPEV